MTLFRNVLKATDNLLSTQRFIIFSRSNLNGEISCSSKVEVPSPPKRPLSAYMIFCKEKRKELGPSLSAPKQIKILAEKWNQLSEDEKKPYELNARRSTQAYGEEHKKFFESLSEEQKEELVKLKTKKMESRRILRNKKALRDAGLPKAPNSGYTLFVQAEAKTRVTGISASEFIKRVAESWKLLPEESKKDFEKQAEGEKKRYAEQMREWRTKMLLEGNKKILKAYEEIKGRVLISEDHPVLTKKQEKKTKK